jgi:hypothetical protein
MGKLVAVCTEAAIRGEAVSDVINHAAAIACIHVPVLDTAFEIQSARYLACRNGPQIGIFSGPRDDLSSANSVALSVDSRIFILYYLFK